ncbi:hypothetical protein GCM10027035_02400 [Emticicia sediminis]
MNLYQKIRLLIEVEGVSGIFFRIKRYLLPNRTTASIFRTYEHIFQDKLALEIGGKSKMFDQKNIFPIYNILSRVDGCNFSTNTVWEGQIVAGVDNYKYMDTKKGVQYVNEGSDLSTIHSDLYDIVLSCHSLEHIANPIKALKEWKRVLKNDGYILLILPHPNFTFDKNRPITKIEHLIEDYLHNVDERDLTCLEEVLNFHERKRDSLGPKTLKELKERSLKNYENRCLHHHVFDFDLIEDIFEYVNMKIVVKEFVTPYHMITLAKNKN